MSPVLQVSLLLVALAAPTERGGAPRYSVSEIHPVEELQGYWLASMDGDERRDLIVAVWSAARKRELTIYLQSGEGGFEEVPDWRVPMKSDIVAFAPADLRSDPGEELVLFTRSSCFGLSPRSATYRGNVRKLFAWDFLCSVPDPQKILRLGTVRDLDGDGRAEILVPGANGYALFGPSRGEAFAERAAFPLTSRGAPESERRRRELRFSLSDGFSSRHENPFDDLVWDRSNEADAADGDLVAAAHWLPSCHHADVDGDGRLDLVYFDSDSSVLKVYRQRQDGGFPVDPSYEQALEWQGQMHLEDLDGDGAVGLVHRLGRGGDDETTLRFFKNFQKLSPEKTGEAALQKPDQVMKISGHGLEWEVVELDGKGPPELVASTYRISTLGALKGGGILRTLLVYRGDPNGVFERRVTFKLEEQFSAAEAQSLEQRVRVGADLEGNGRRSALSIGAGGELVARAFRASLQLETTPHWRFVPRWGVKGIEVVQFNVDARSDLVLRHARSLTVLVSR